MPANTTELEKRLWGALGLIFLRYAEHKFTVAKAKFTT